MVQYTLRGGATLTVRNCIIENNTNTTNGGAIVVGENCNLIIEDTKITNNSTTGNGGAIYVGQNSVVTISGNSLITDNIGNYGGGIYLESGAKLNGGASGLEYFINNTSTVNQEIWQNVYYNEMEFTLYLNDSIINSQEISTGTVLGSSCYLSWDINLNNSILNNLNDYYHFPKEKNYMVDSIDGYIDMKPEWEGLSFKSIVGYNKIKYTKNTNDSYSISKYDTNIVGKLILQGEYNGLLVTSITGNYFQYAKVSHVDFSQASNLLTIPSTCFYNCTNLESVELGNVKTIAQKAFYKCALKSLKIPQSVESVSERAFESNFYLQDLTIDTKNATFANYVFARIGENVDECQVTIGENVESITGKLFNGGNSTVYCYITKVVIKANNFNIPESAFSSCQRLTDVIFEKNVASFGFCAFSACSALESILLTGNVVLKGQVFRNCLNLKSIGDTNKYQIIQLGGLDFEYCKNLTSVCLGEGLTSISDQTFRGCLALEEIIIPSSVTSIGKYAFTNCSSLTYILYQAKNITSMYSLNIFDLVGSVENGCVLEIGEGVVNIPAYMLYGTGSSTYCNISHIKLPSTLTSVGAYAFANCLKLKIVEHLASGTTFNECAFKGSTNIETVKISSINNWLGTTFIDVYSTPFNNKTATLMSLAGSPITSVKLNQTGKISVSNYIFYGTSITSLNISGYTTCDIRSFAFAYCDLERINITGYYGTYYEPVETLPILDISDSAFEGCSEISTANITSYVKIGKKAFYECRNMDATFYTEVLVYDYEDIWYPDSKTIYFDIQSIGEYAFYNCASLKEMDLSTLNTIGQYAFSGCSSLGNVDISALKGEIYKGTFQGCASFTEITIPSGVTGICQYAFNNCSNLSVIKWDNGSTLTHIDNLGFGNCPLITRVSLPVSLEILRTGAFDGCSITDVVIPYNCTRVGRLAFGDTLEALTFENESGWYLVCENTADTDFVVYEPVDVGSSVVNIRNYYTIHATEPKYDGYDNYYYFQK